MAIARGAGTEIIRAHHFSEIAGEQAVIVGVQHHIYTVLSVIVNCQALNAAADQFSMYILGWDNVDGDSSTARNYIFTHVLDVGETFVWNDKFSMNGYEPTGISGALDTATEQDALADQGGSTAQVLQVNATHGSDNFDVNVTFIDQNNA